MPDFSDQPALGTLVYFVALLLLFATPGVLIVLGSWLIRLRGAAVEASDPPSSL